MQPASSRKPPVAMGQSVGCRPSRPPLFSLFFSPFLHAKNPTLEASVSLGGGLWGGHTLTPTTFGGTPLERGRRSTPGELRHTGW